MGTFDKANTRFISPTELSPLRAKKGDTTVNSKPKFSPYFSSRRKINPKDKLGESVKEKLEEMQQYRQKRNSRNIRNMEACDKFQREPFVTDYLWKT